MIDKKDIKCLQILKEGPFFQELLAYIESNDGKKFNFRIRAMYKQSIVRNKLDEEMVLNELKIRSNLRHPFLINQICAFQDYDNLFYITEYAPVKILDNDLIKVPFHPEVVRFYAAEIFLALDYLHRKGQIYTFLSPENIYIDSSGHIKLEYSFCNCLNETEDEVLRRIEYASMDYIMFRDFSMAGDFWSMGIVLYLMSIGYTPFGCETFEETVRGMKTEELEFPENVDRDLADLVTKLTYKDAKKRLGATLEDSIIIMNHPYFKNIDWKLLESKRLPPPYIPTLNLDYKNTPFLSTLFTSDYIFGNKDGYGDTFTKYNTTYFMKSNNFN